MIDAPPPAAVAMVNSAVDHFRLYGWAVTYPEVQIVSDEDTSLGLAGGFVGGALPGRVFLTQFTAESLGILGRIAAKPTVKARIRSLRACDYRCLEAASTALHEVAHLVQFQQKLVTDKVHFEGGADAVALDLMPGYLRRMIGRTFLYEMEPAYPEYVRRVRVESAAATGRPWRSPTARAFRFERLGS